MKKTLFHWVDDRGQTVIAGVLGVHKSTISKILGGSLGVSSRIHAKAVETWGDAYDVGGTTTESLKRLGLLPVPDTSQASNAL